MSMCVTRVRKTCSPGNLAHEGDEGKSGEVETRADSIKGWTGG